ncbi:major histocompatibility complex class I-related gene protein-like [Hemicordylus capensis]|uniref:major histocompatibility complex class I-related gene protein-like n=1 Tax=Hemicordylus capensis TaxID=884348 RepID=UPI0023025A3F|nr:major histocompatibility complex class I-related gene protein-like [Hemicordylus capensis]
MPLVSGAYGFRSIPMTLLPFLAPSFSNKKTFRLAFCLVTTQRPASFFDWSAPSPWHASPSGTPTPPPATSPAASVQPGPSGCRWRCVVRSVQMGVPPWWCLLPLVLGGCSGSSSRSLSAFFTLLSEPIQEMPEFLILGYLDDQFMVRYDSNRRACLTEVPWVKKVADSDQRFWRMCSETAQMFEEKLRKDLAFLQQHYDQSSELHTLQLLYDCVLSKDGSKRGYYKLAYDGRDSMSLDTDTFTWMAGSAEAQKVKGLWEAERMDIKMSMIVLTQECTTWMQKYTDYLNESLWRREPPVVRMAWKMTSDVQETLICRAYGFYPKEIDATWKKDEEVWEQETLHGDVTPNSDGTYHTWLSTKIDSKDRHRYQCHVQHASLAEPLDLSWGKPVERLHTSMPVWVIVLGVMAALLVAGIIICIKRKRMVTGISLCVRKEQREEREMATQPSEAGNIVS